MRPQARQRRSEWLPVALAAGLLLSGAACGSSGSPPPAPGAGGTGGAGAGTGGTAGNPGTGSGGGAGTPGTGGGPGASGGGPDGGMSPGPGTGSDSGSGTGPGSGADSGTGTGTGTGSDSGTGSGSSADTAPPPPPPPPPPWIELTAPAISVQGGVARGAGGLGQAGGTVHLVSADDIAIDPTRPAAAPPVVPAVPATATAVTGAALGANVAAGGSAQIADVTSGGADGIRSISVSNGDLFVTGTLRAADLGAARQGLRLSAPAGTVYVTGAVDTSGAAGTGQAGGAITIAAQRVVITGRLTSAGGDRDGRAGAAGAISITAGQNLSVTGGLDAFGGNARGPAGVVGGQAASINLEAEEDLVLSGTVRLRGGAAVGQGADAEGGSAGTLHLTAGGAAEIGGVIDGRGGLATADVAGGRVVAGSAGSLLVGSGVNDTIPATIAVRGPINARGGDGPARGGKGGSFRAEPDVGDVLVSGARAIDVDGGSALTAPGEGGQVFVSARDDTSNGGATVRGEISAGGGNVLAGGAGAGAAGGRIALDLSPINGPIEIAATGKLSALGGRSGGAAVAGGGGHVVLITNDGNLTMSGTIAAQGGEAPDPGGTGGLGGSVHLWSDRNGNADLVRGGNLLIAPTGLIDASGGNGSIGGDARNDGIPDTAAEFPLTQELLSILIDCDNVDGPTLNWIDNRGRLIARGGARNGDGGDVLFHGITPDGEEPVPGNIDLAGNGTGSPGDFGSE